MADWGAMKSKDGGLGSAIMILLGMRFGDLEKHKSNEDLWKLAEHPAVDDIYKFFAKTGSVPPLAVMFGIGLIDMWVAGGKQPSKVLRHRMEFVD